MINLESWDWSREDRGEKRRFLHPHSLWLLRTSLSQPGGKAEEFLRKIWGGRSGSITVQVLEPSVHPEGAGRVV